MDVIRRIFGYVHIVLGVAIALQFLASEMYDDELVIEVWDVLDFFMAIGVIAALVFSYLRSRAADSSDLREWVASTAMFISAGVLFLLFFEQWFAWEIFRDTDDEPGDFRGLLWVTIDVLFVVVNIVVGGYLLRSNGSVSDD